MNAKWINIITNVVGFLLILLEPIKSYLTTQTFSWETFLLCIGGAVVAYFTGKSTLNAQKDMLKILVVGLMFSLVACGSWQKTTVISYDVASIVMKTAKDSAVTSCNAGQIEADRCQRLKTYYTQAKSAFIIAGDLLIMIIKTEDSLKAKQLQVEYQLKIADFTKLGNDFLDLAYTTGVTKTKFVIK